MFEKYFRNTYIVEEETHNNWTLIDAKIYDRDNNLIFFQLGLEAKMVEKYWPMRQYTIYNDQNTWK